MGVIAVVLYSGSTWNAERGLMHSVNIIHHQAVGRSQGMSKGDQAEIGSMQNRQSAAFHSNTQQDPVARVFLHMDT